MQHEPVGAGRRSSPKADFIGLPGLLELVDTLAQLPVAADGRRTEAQTSGDGASKGSQLTDALKIDQAGSLHFSTYHVQQY